MIVTKKSPNFLAPEEHKNQNNSSHSVGPSSVLGMLAANHTLSKQDCENFIKDEELLFCHIENPTIEAGEPIRGSVYFSTPRDGVQNTKINITFKGMLHVKTGRERLAIGSIAGQGDWSMKSDSSNGCQDISRNKSKIITIPLVSKSYHIYTFQRKVLPGYLYQIPFVKETHSDLPPTVQAHFQRPKASEKKEKGQTEKMYLSSLRISYDISASIGVNKGMIVKHTGLETIVHIKSQKNSKEDSEPLFSRPKCVDLDHVFAEHKEISFFEPIIDCCRMKKANASHPIEFLVPKNEINHRAIFRFEKTPRNECQLFILMPRWLMEPPQKMKFELLLHVSLANSMKITQKIISIPIPVKYKETFGYTYNFKRDEYPMIPVMDFSEISVFYEVRIVFKMASKSRKEILFSESPFDISPILGVNIKENDEYFLSQDNIDESFEHEINRYGEPFELPFAYLPKSDSIGKKKELKK